MRRIFWGFWRNWFLMSPLHYLSGRTDFGFEYDTGSQRLPVSPIRRVGYWIFLNKTLCIDDTESRPLPAPVILWVADSPYPWVGESPTPRITDTESRRLRVSLSRGVDDSAYRWYGESLFGKKIFSFDFPYFKRLKHAFKGSIWPKISQGCIVLSQ